MAGPDPAVAAVRSAVAAALDPLPAGATVLVACSGGPDSMALAAATAFVAQRRGARRWRAGAVLVDHGLQPGSAEVAASAAAQCRAWGLDPVEVVRVRVDGPGGTEAAARTARYAALDAAALRHGAVAVLVGHTRDDQAEGVLLGLARGSGTRSLAGMAPVRGTLVRPLLGLGRDVTHAACAALGVEPWLDPTNVAPLLELLPAAGTGEGPGGSGAARRASTAPLRSRVRSRVLPVLERELGPGVAAALARSADVLREDADALDALAGALLDRAVVDPSGALPDVQPAPPRTARAVHLDPAVLAPAPAALLHRALRAAAVHAGSPAGSLARTHLLAVAALVTHWHGQGPVHLPGGVRAFRACGRLILRAEPPTAVRQTSRGPRADATAGAPAAAVRSDTNEESGSGER
ncbi:MAG TPA: tRNA lysidine(34) synthetase TilS [Cellulomonas sp.]